MSDHIHFPNAPIVESLLDIRCILPSEINLSTLASFHERIKNDFPIKEERISWQAGFEIKAGNRPELISPKGGPDGYLFHPTDKKRIVQARLDGFTFNKLKPYTKWEDFSGEAKKLWQHYSEVAKPVKVVRIALRYINRIEIPIPFKDFGEYIKTVPQIGDGIPKALSGLFMRLVIPNPELKAMAIITETVDKIDEKNNKLPLIFDIDVYMEQPFELQTDTIWKAMVDLHEFEYSIFIKSITNKTEELFK
ncbi:MAG: TIGR04255 family protein [Planctomycetota bacterium]